MHISVERSALLAHVRAAASITSPRATFPLERMIFLSCEEELLQVEAAPQNKHYTGAIRGERKRSGRALVDAQDLLSRVETMPAGSISLQTHGDKLAIKSGKRQATIPTARDEEFRLHDIGDVEPILRIGADRLVALLARVAWVVNPSDAKLHEHCLALKVEHQRLWAGGMTGAQAARIVVQSIEANPATVYEAQIPMPGLQSLMSFAKNLGKSVLALSASDRFLVARCEDEGNASELAVMPAALPRSKLEENFLLFEKEIQQELVVPRAAFLDLVKLARLSASAITHGVTFVASKGLLHLLATEQGATHDSVSTATPIEHPACLVYNADLLQKMLAVFVDADISLAYDAKSHAKPLFAYETGEGYALTCLMAGLAVAPAAGSARLLSGEDISIESIDLA